jgi:hypothetical protein
LEIGEGFYGLAVVEANFHFHDARVSVGGRVIV